MMLAAAKRRRPSAREPRRFQLGDTKHLDCVMREAQCRSDSSTFQYTMAQVLESEIRRMRMLGATAERIAAFRSAAEVHIALCHASAVREGVEPAESSLDTTDTKNC
jgi:hypothetical protein